VGTTLVSINPWYIELIENRPFELRDHLKWLSVLVRQILDNFNTKLYQDCKFSATKFLQKETLSGLELKI
jgi:hypothetical protein